jgi:hypothetical protein
MYLTGSFYISVGKCLFCGDNIDTIKKNTQTLIEASKGIGLEVNTDKTKYMSLSRHQNSGQNHDIKKVTDGLKMWHSSDIWGR